MTLENKVDGLSIDLGKLSIKFDWLATKVDVLSNKVDTLATAVDTLAKTVENLAIMTKEGFDHINGRVDGVEEKFEKRFDGVDFRLDRIENISVGNQERRIENIEYDMRVVKTKLKLG